MENEQTAEDDVGAGLQEGDVRPERLRVHRDALGFLRLVPPPASD
ncbi:hypothetical protein [Streptomyces sp. WG7]